MNEATYPPVKKITIDVTLDVNIPDWPCQLQAGYVTIDVGKLAEEQVQMLADDFIAHCTERRKTILKDVPKPHKTVKGYS